jgi:tetratricopeptide (TPR) repeat protein
MRGESFMTSPEPQWDTVIGLGSAAISKGKVKEALNYFEQALAMAQAMGDRDKEGTALEYRGLVASLQVIKRGQQEEAIRYWQQALLAFREVGNRAAEGNTLRMMGETVAIWDREEEAQPYFEQALAIFEALGATDDAENARKRLAKISAARQRRGWRPFGR